MLNLLRSGPARWALLVTVILVYLWFGFYTTESVTTHDNAVVRSADGTLSFAAPGIALTRDVGDWLGRAIEHENLEIVVDARPLSLSQHGPARILSLSGDVNFRNFTLGQDNADLVVRWRRTAAMWNGTPEFVIKNVFTDQQRHRIHVVADRKALTVLVDDVVRLDEPLPEHAFKTWTPEYWLTLGNEVTFDRPWLGVIHAARIGVNGEWIDYLERGRLGTPANYYPESFKDRIYQIMPFVHEHYTMETFIDWAVNLLGFAPLGALLVWQFPARIGVGRATACAFLLSLTIESIQFVLPWRYPGMDDLLLNTAGGFLGAWLMAHRDVRQSQRA